MYKNGKVDSFQGSTLPKIRIASKKALNKSCSKLNFIPKCPRTHMSIFPQSGARWLERFPSLQNNNVQKWESRCSLGLDTAKNTHHIKKRLMRVRKHGMFPYPSLVQRSEGKYRFHSPSFQFGVLVCESDRTMVESSKSEFSIVVNFQS